LVARDTCEEDRRGTWASITESGIERISAVLPGHLDDVQEWFTGLLPPVQLTALTDALRVVRDAVHPEAVAGG
jgi:MarR family 2-MHQ and catechol resistance regulon transcriptional repressor